MNTTYELNNLRKDSDVFNGKFSKQSPVVEIFSAMVNGEELSKFGAKADKAAKYITELGDRAEKGDWTAVAELNTLRRFAIETPVMQELKLLGIFGTYTPVGYDETIEREVYNYGGEKSREQAAGGDVVFPTITKDVYTVPTFTVSGGYAVDYRRVALGDMSKEHEGMNRVRTDIRNRALLAIVNKIYDAIKKANGVKYMVESAGLTKTGVDNALTNVRRFGKPTVIADYALLSQFSSWAGYSSNASGNLISGISEKTMNEIAQDGLISSYNGAVLKEMPNPYNLDALNADRTNFETMLPAGLGFIIPTGAQSPIATYTRGGLTSFTGNNVKNGKVETRFDIEVGCDLAKGQEYKLATIYDTNVGGLSVK